MRIEHLNLVVKNLKNTLSFYRAALPHWRVRGGGEGEWYGKPRTWIHFGNDTQYLAFSDFGEGENRDLKGHGVGFAHLAFEVTNMDELVARLTKAGFTPTDTGGTTEYRRNEYFIDPDGFEVEFIQYFSDLPERRNHYDTEFNHTKI